MVQVGKIFFWSVFVTAAILRRWNKTTTMMNFRWINFFNTCEAMASVGVHRFGCGFLHWFNFFTEYFSNNVFKVIRHTLHGELTMKLKNIWWSIKIVFKQVFSRFFWRWTMHVSRLRLCMIIRAGINSFGYISSWQQW